MTADFTPTGPTLLHLNAWEQLRAGRMWRRLIQLLIGLVGYGAAVMILVQSGLGAASWNVLTEGVARQTGMTFGWSTNVIAAVVLLAWIPLREMPGLGTLLNVCLVGLAADWTAALLPAADTPAAQIAYLALGIVCLALFDALYLGAQLGAGPRDGIMTGVTRATGQPVWRVRTCIEVVVAASGWLLGGTLGIGTILVALCMGPLLGVLLPRTVVRLTVPVRPVGPGANSRLQ
ncbi:membrane protein YczE [Cellulomonas wangsupingiae]|uniref:membrane protein YczE n=1 Tax=Cellulomonas wangsupingiae TaxID=2968085 RepID=UPI001D0DD97D|nr:hypothetical protein [Cellulomonas wangsupingiae]MCM0639335.1 hypothetical protein [Cellulomonas wangsupingiae]